MSDAQDELAVSFADVQDAAHVLSHVVRRTPVLTSESLDAVFAERNPSIDHERWNELTRLHFKCENLQRVGAFKFRGAYNALCNLTEDEQRRGVIAFSSGNHAQAVAAASTHLGLKCTSVRPSDAPRVKLEATRWYLEAPGWRDEASGIVFYERGKEDREQVVAGIMERLPENERPVLIPPFDHPHIIAGQGTCAMELIEQTSHDFGDPVFDEHLDYLFVPCGGGGLLSGCATATKAMLPDCKVIGVEPAGGDDGVQSFRAGELRRVEDPQTIADGARTPTLGKLTFAIIRERVDDMISVSDGQIVEAMRLIWERLNVVAEPTGALGLAGAMSYAPEGGFEGKRIGIVISGGNVDVSAMFAQYG
jgi:threonine dehydratase